MDFFNLVKKMDFTLNITQLFLLYRFYKNFTFPEMLHIYLNSSLMSLEYVESSYNITEIESVIPHEGPLKFRLSAVL